MTDEELLRRYADGDVGAREQIARRYMPLARRLAAKHRNSSEPPEDLEQVAYLGLLKTIDRYQPGRGSFTGYAVTTIRGELKRHFRDHGWTLHVPRSLQERYLKVNGAVQALTTELGRPPTPAEVGRKTDLAVDEVVEALDVANGYTARSLDAPLGEDDGDGTSTLGDMLGASDPGYETVETGQAVAPAFRALPEREQVMLRLRFVDDLTQAEIAARCGVSQMHVSRLLRRSLHQLLEALEEPEGRSSRPARTP